MAAVVTDTHALVWYFLDQGRLSTDALAAFDQASADRDLICLPTIAIVEMIYLVEKRRLPEAALSRLLTELGQQFPIVATIPLDQDIARILRQIPRDVVPDMPDRIIAATALHLGLPLITRDAKIRLAQITTIW